MESLFCGHWLPPFIALAIAALLGYILGRLWQGKNKRRIAELEDDNQSLRAKLGAGGAIATGAVASANSELKVRIAGLKDDLKAAKSREAELTKKVAELEEAGVALGAAGGNSDRLTRLEADLAFSRNREDELNSRIGSLEADLAACEESKAGLLAAASSAVVRDDLKKVEGIGPKIEGLLNDAGIYSYAQLADADPASIKQILSDAGNRYRMHDPGTWPEQAAMARDGRWEELNVWQDELKGGK